MNSTNSHKIRHKKCANDVFYTPQTAVLEHLELLKPIVKKGDVIYDAFAGKGGYYNEYAKMFPDCEYCYTEIEEGSDFFEYNKKVDVIVTNPPYSILTKIFKKCVELQPRVISFLMGQMNLTIKRIQTMNENGYYLTGVHLIRVHGWFGTSQILTFTKSTIKDQCITFTDTIHYTK
jgi:DNA modification methylase